MKKRDFLLIGSILAVALALLLVVELTRQEGAYVLVRVGGQECGKYYLSESGTYELNGGTNILVIEDGVAYLTDANCPVITGHPQTQLAGTWSYWSTPTMNRQLKWPHMQGS